MGGGYNGGILSGGFCPGGFCPSGILSRGILSGGFCPGGFCPRTTKGEEGRGEAVSRRPHYLINPKLYKSKILQGIRDTFQGPRKSTVSRKSFVWLPWQLFDNMVFFPNNCQNVYEKQVIFKCFQKPQISRCQNKTLPDDSSILLLFIKVILKWVGVPDFWEGHVENRAKCRKMVIFPGLKQGIFPGCP